MEKPHFATKVIDRYNGTALACLNTIAQLHQACLGGRRAGRADAPSAITTEEVYAAMSAGRGGGGPRPGRER